MHKIFEVSQVRRNRMHCSLTFKMPAWALFTLSLIALGCGLAYGQAISGDLTGTVLDQSGAVVNGATVEAANTATGQTVSTTTKGQGEYRFRQLPVGNYTLTVRAQGF